MTPLRTAAIALALVAAGCGGKIASIDPGSSSSPEAISMSHPREGSACGAARAAGQRGLCLESPETLVPLFRADVFASVDDKTGATVFDAILGEPGTHADFSLLLYPFAQTTTFLIDAPHLIDVPYEKGHAALIRLEQHLVWNDQYDYAEVVESVIWNANGGSVTCEVVCGDVSCRFDAVPFVDGWGEKRSTASGWLVAPLPR